MSGDSELEEPEGTAVETVDDRTASARCDEGFLRMRRLTLRNRYADGACSEPYRYDLVERDAMDAVALVLETEDGRICLRTALRPPLAFRPAYELPFPEGAQALLWEVPAGLVEPGERGERGLASCAVREALEEVGATLAPEDFVALGGPACLSPGVLGEKIYFLRAQVEPASLEAPLEDGTPVEERAEVRFIPLGTALDAVDRGRIADLKTEVAIRRLAALRAAR